MSEAPVQILLVEDNEDDIVLIQESFRDADHVRLLAVVRDGEQALAYLRRVPPYEDARRPDLVMLDINMPRKSGFEVLDEMKADPELRSIPTVMLTTSAREEDVERSYAGGACSYLTKPVGFDELRSTVRSFALYWSMVARVPRADNGF